MQSLDETERRGDPTRRFDTGSEGRSGGRGGLVLVAVVLVAIVAMMSIALGRLTTDQGSGSTSRPRRIAVNPFDSHHQVSVLGRVPVILEEPQGDGEPVTSLGADPVILDLATDEVTALPERIATLATSEPDFAISPDGSRLAFVGHAPDEDERAVFVADLDGRHLQQVSRGSAWVSTHLAPAWSPDGRSLAYVSHGPRFDVQHLYVVDLVSGRRTSLARARQGLEWFVAPMFAPDGRSILVSKRSADLRHSTVDLWTVPLDGARPTLLLEDAIFGTYSPDGSTIAYRRASPGDDYARPISSDVRFADADGTRLGRRLGSGGSVMAPLYAWAGERPVWSPKGRRILASVALGGAFRMRVRVLHVANDRGPSIGASSSAAWIDNHTLLVEEDLP